MVYVSMIDKFCSNWGPCEGKENVLIFECESLDEAFIVQENGENRSDMKSVEVHIYYPDFDENIFFIQEVDRSDYIKFYQKGGF